MSKSKNKQASAVVDPVPAVVDPVVNHGCAITSLKGVISEGDPAPLRVFPPGTNFTKLVASGHIVPEEEYKGTKRGEVMKELLKRRAPVV